MIRAEIREELKKEIDSYLGQEIFFGGLLDEAGEVYSVDLLARGNINQVPVVFEEAIRYEVVIHNHPSSHLRPSDADLEIAASLGNYGVGFYIIDNEAADVNVVVPRASRAEVFPIEPEEIDDVFGPEGKLAAKNADYETRPSQLAMVRGAVDAFNHNRIFLCEAPTGTGKSLAYLVPALLWIKHNKEKIVVSTHTIHLQEQLLKKDIPFLSGLLGGDFRYALVKGRNHYLCQKKFREFESEFPLPSEGEPDNTAEIEELKAWGRSTKTGDKAELSFVPGTALWDRLASESDTCRKSKCTCPEACHYQNARKEIFSADLLVVNHHVLLADLAIKHQAGKFNSQALLPAYARLVVDEAHNLEEVATQYFGESATLSGVQRTLGLLLRPGAGRGVIRKIEKKIRAGSHNQSDGDIVEIFKAFEQLESERGLFSEVARSAAAELYDYLSRASGGDHAEKKWRIRPSHLKEPGFIKGFQEPLLRILAPLGKIQSLLGKIKHRLESEKEDEDWERLLHDLSAFTDRLLDQMSVFDAMLEEEKENEVRWVTASRYVGRNEKGFSFSASVTPLEASRSLREAVFESVSTAVLASATLSDHRGFQFLKENLGLAENGESDPRVVEEKLPSHFQFREQCLAFIPSDMPLPSEAGYSAKAADYIVEALNFFRGRTMILFTSYSQLLEVKHLIRDKADELGLDLLVQGERPRHQLLDRFREGRSAVLLGVSSFWEGVDIPGESLSCLIMVKLPFGVPSEPVYEAKMEALERRGKNAFSEYAIPSAIIRFKQGFGRLIRTSSDRGLFVVLDRRILEKSYGRNFLMALPDLRMVKGTDLAEAAAEIFGERVFE